MTIPTRNSGPWDFITHRDYSKRYQEIKDKLLSNEQINDGLENLQTAGVNREQFLTPIVNDIIMRQRGLRPEGWMAETARQKREYKRLAAQTRDCASNLAKVVYDEGTTIPGMMALAKQLEGRARACGMMAKFMGPQINRGQIEILLFFLQGMTGNALPFLPIVEQILEAAYEMCGIRLASLSLPTVDRPRHKFSSESLEKIYRRYVLPILPKNLRRQNPPRK